MSNLKKLVESRMQETGETYQRAAFNVKFATPDRNKELQHDTASKLDGFWKAALGPDNRQPSTAERQRYREALANSAEEFLKETSKASAKGPQRIQEPRIKIMRIA